jgi:hypothetical protein
MVPLALPGEDDDGHSVLDTSAISSALDSSGSSSETETDTAEEAAFDVDVELEGPPARFHSDMFKAEHLLGDVDSIRELSFIERGKAVARYNVDLFWATLWCTFGAIAVLCFIRFAVYRDNKLWQDRSGRDPEEYWPLMLWDGTVLATIVSVLIVSNSLWWQFGWPATKKIVLVGTVVSVVFFTPMTVLLDLYVTPAGGTDLGLFLEALGVIVALCVFLFWATGRLQKTQSIRYLRRKVFFAVLLWVLVMFVYFSFLPPIYLAVDQDWQRALLRILLHPLLFESAASIARQICEFP